MDDADAAVTAPSGTYTARTATTAPDRGRVAHAKRWGAFDDSRTAEDIRPAAVYDLSLFPATGAPATVAPAAPPRSRASRSVAAGLPFLLLLPTPPPLLFPRRCFAGAAAAPPRANQCWVMQATMRGSLRVPIAENAITFGGRRDRWPRISDGWLRGGAAAPRPRPA